jgi:hypothetical protein
VGGGTVTQHDCSAEIQTCRRPCDCIMSESGLRPDRRVVTQVVVTRIGFVEQRLK